MNSTLMIILSGILYGLLGYFGITLLEAGLSISTMLFWRFAVATAMLFPLIWKQRSSFSAQSSQNRFNIFLDAFFYAVSAAFYFLACKAIGTGLSTALFFTYPAFVIALSWLMDKQKIRPYTLLSLVFLLIGLFLLKHTEPDQTFDTSGLLLALVASLIYAFYIYRSKKQAQTISALFSTFYLCCLSSMMFFVYSFLEGSMRLPSHPTYWLHILMIALLCTALPAFLLLVGLETVESGKASILSVFEPVVTVLIGAWFLEEILTLGQIFGIATIVLGTVCIQWDDSKTDLYLDSIKSS